LQKKCSHIAMYVGTGVGLVLFILYGLLPGSFLGGVAGLKIAGALFGLPLEAGLIAKSIVLVFILLGLLLSALTIIFVSIIASIIFGCGIGWLIHHIDSTAVTAEVNVKNQ